LEHTPLVRAIMPKAGKKVLHLLEPGEFERLLLACRAGAESDVSVERAAARNRAILWVFLDTGIRVSELCGLRLSDVDCEQRALRIQEKGGKERWVMLSANGWYQLLSYLEQYRPKGGCSQGKRVEEDHLFLSEWYEPLTINAITLLFDRLRKRAGIIEKPVSPSVLRDTFAVRFLQAGGTLEALRDLLGLRDLAALKRYARLSTYKSEHDQPKEPSEVQPSRPRSARQTKRQRRRRPSSATPKHHRQQSTGRSDGSARKKPITDGKDDP
jgi:site-specific recombinase XerD